MKQGRARVDGPADRKVEPRSRAVNPAGVAQIGNSQGNHATDTQRILRGAVENVYAGRGYKAPMRSVNTSNSGSQGRHE